MKVSIKKRYCENCGYKIDVKTVFCPVCAFKVGDPVYEKKKITLKRKVIIGVLLAFIVLVAIGSLLPTSEMEKRIEQLQDHNYIVTKGDWQAILAKYIYPSGSVDDFDYGFEYASYDSLGWDKFEEASENVYDLCVSQGIGQFFKVWYDESNNKIFFLAPEGVLPEDTNYIVFYTTKN